MPLLPAHQLHQRCAFIGCSSFLLSRAPFFQAWKGSVLYCFAAQNPTHREDLSYNHDTNNEQNLKCLACKAKDIRLPNICKANICLPLICSNAQAPRTTHKPRGALKEAFITGEAVAPLKPVANLSLSSKKDQHFSLQVCHKRKRSINNPFLPTHKTPFCL